MEQFTRLHDSNFRPPKDREFLTSMPTNFEALYLGTTMLHYLSQIIHCLRQHQPNIRLSNCCLKYHILCYWIKRYVYVLNCDKSEFIVQIKAKKKSAVYSSADFGKGEVPTHIWTKCDSEVPLGRIKFFVIKFCICLSAQTSTQLRP